MIEAERAAMGVVGQALPRSDGPAKVTGRARYIDDLPFPHALVGMLLRSPHPHARIVSLDTSAAEALPGVEAVVTARDFPPALSGRRFKDRSLVARDTVRYVGEPVAAVAAVDRETASQALSLIQVAYAPLPAVFDVADAIRPDAPLVHPDVEQYAGFTRGAPRDGLSLNVATYSHIERGEVDPAFADPELVVVEATYRTQRQGCCPMEPHGAVAEVDPTTGRVRIWATTAAPFRVRAQVAEFLGLPPGQIEVLPSCVGGSFGSKLEADPEPFAAALARKARRPVKIVFSRGEEFVGSTQRLPTQIWMRTAATRQGQLVAREARLFYNTGARANVGSLVTAYASMLASGPYRIPHVRITGYAVYTHNVPGGAFRGFGDPQVCFAYESQMDELARALGLAPVELRRRNLVEEGEVMPSGQTMRSVTARECLEVVQQELAAELAGEPPIARRARRGVGVACSDSLYGGFPAGASVRLNEDGSAVVAVGTPDIGQGSETVLAQIAAESLGLPPSQVRTVVSGTDTAPFDMGAFASRITFHTGNAVRQAAERVRERLVRYAGEMLEVSPADLVVEKGAVHVAGSPGRAVSVADVARYTYFVKEETLDATGTHGAEAYNVPLAVDGTAYGVLCTNSFTAQAAIVDVDVETGQVVLRKLIAAVDCGRAINPGLAQAQIHGGAATGASMALWEELVSEAGQPRNAEFKDYLLPTCAEVPPIAAHLVELAQPDGPFGAKGMGDAPPTAAVAAVANAVADAVGAPVRQLPLTPERVLAALDAVRASAPSG